jgi:tRNA A-37 threonylcarbamoyl transferase component Bud32
MSGLKLINADSAAVELDDHGLITWTVLAVSFGVDFYVLQRSVHQINENRVSLYAALWKQINYHHAM